MEAYEHCFSVALCSTSTVSLYIRSLPFGQYLPYSCAASNSAHTFSGGVPFGIF